MSGPEGVPHEVPPPASGSIEDPEYTELAIAVTACSSRKNGVSSYVPSDQSHRFTPVNTTPNFTGSSTLPDISRNTPAVVSSRPPARLVSGVRKCRKVFKGPYSCDICGKRYEQQQNVLRHRKKDHNDPHSCIVPGCEDKWNRPDEFRAHLINFHPDIDPDKVIGKPAGARHKSKIMGRDIPPPRTIESVRWSHGKPRQRSTTLRLPAVANVITHAPLFSMSSVANDPRPEHLEPAITMRKHEYARSVEFLHDTGAPSVFSSTEDCAELANDLDISTQGGQLWSVHVSCTTYVISDP